MAFTLAIADRDGCGDLVRGAPEAAAEPPHERPGFLFRVCARAAPDEVGPGGFLAQLLLTV